jgi:hypothetical protein
MGAGCEELLDRPFFVRMPRGARPSASAGQPVGRKGPVRALRLATLLLTLGGAAGLLAGCGGSSSAVTPAAERLQRADLVAVVHGLRQAEPSAAREMAAARNAWPLVADGLPAAIPPSTQASLSAASHAAREIVLPPLMGETRARSLTGPAAGITGLFRTFHGLAGRGWTLIAASGEEISSGSPAAARFARANVALYIDSVYDGHFDAALLGKSLLAGYKKLGGPAAFGAMLTQAEVDALAGAYSPASERLHPHPGVKLGS